MAALGIINVILGYYSLLAMSKQDYSLPSPLGEGLGVRLIYYMDTYVLHEITPLMETDALYIADRHKKEFSYPVHNHDVFELNFVENAAGVRRTVGDNSEVIGDFDLVLFPNVF